MLIFIERHTRSEGGQFSTVHMGQFYSVANIGWGSPQNPTCRGLTKEEIAQIDFSKLDLSEINQELMSRYQEKDFSSYVNQRPNLLQNIDTQIKLIQKELSVSKDKKPERAL